MKADQHLLSARFTCFSLPHRRLISRLLSRRPWDILLLVGVFAGACTVAVAQDFIARTNRYRDRKPSIDTVDAIRVLSMDQAAKLESEVQKVYARLAPSVVRFWNDESKTLFGTGTIIEEGGLILTCAHFGLDPGAKLTVELSNGRRIRGVALGRFEQKRPDFGPDIGLVRITDKGAWPTATIDPKQTVKGGEICVAIGYPGTLAEQRPPLLRLGRVLPPLPDWHWVRATTSCLPGDSGGPLFGLDGRVLGVANGGEGGRPTRYQPIAPFHEHRDRLIAGEIVSAPIALFRALDMKVVHPAAFGAALDLEDTVLDSRLSTVHVVDGSGPSRLQGRDCGKNCLGGHAA